MTDIDRWLEGVGLGRYADAFAAQEIDLDTLAHLTESDLKEMGLPIGPRRKLLAAMSEVPDAGGGPRRPPPGARPSAARSR